MRFIFCMLFFFGRIFLQAQQTVSGIVLDHNKNPISGANVYLGGTYDGATTAADGTFNFQTSTTGDQTLVVSFVSFLPFRKTMPVDAMTELEIQLREDVTAFDAVVLSAGTFYCSKQL